MVRPVASAMGTDNDSTTDARTFRGTVNGRKVEMNDDYRYVALVAEDQFGFTQLAAPPHIVKEGTERTFCGLTASRFDPVSGRFLFDMACSDCRVVIARIESGEGGF